MAKQKNRKKQSRPGSLCSPTTPLIRQGGASPHGELVDGSVHLFVDDQNLFWNIVNNHEGIYYRIDFGKLLMEACRNTIGCTRGVKSAYIAGVIPDDDTFWQIAENQGFTVRRGFLGANNRSKQDDAFLITDMTATLFEQQGPSTIVLVAGDADYMPPLQRAVQKGWRTEAAYVQHGTSSALHDWIHEFRTIKPSDIEKEYTGPPNPFKFR